ncbi:hypothetical protein A3742_15510 [Oleiphilus sp. HI0071]|nr:MULTISPECIES: exodeoxyribonuclease V subunit gamma [unclassified Oleiphilus]KZY72425.1 hypothetical protein A3737_09895 [Oleiphilus sp. HI0065]KZY90172.1 hypothetical protein A3742_15510 [Oleiphilus sp. HI0071]KZZ04695.1 hypothetical protein A3744_08370 [Oleiphilus sp. HI0073]KZZ44991.1 hypothetical protein A3758_03365 [Oleiphilus sp. HI0118]KZZ49494.1 hypothetical protein A3760_15040 [Oleiphilus sp. HI0122]KZZ71059.1 hypothetical protein A3765_15365 [Oleiphilus sp. HI0130]KZZ81149.1 hypo
MLYLYPSNKTETLAQILAKLQSTPPLADPFASEIVLTQSYGMGVWLKQRISDHQGIACMVDTQMPGAFLWQLIESLVSEKSEHSSTVQHFEKSTLRWEIFRLLPDLIDQPEFDGLRAYVDSLVARSGRSGREQSLFQVSEILADNFDAYQNYRNDWITAWERREPLTDKVSEFSSASTQQEEAWQRIVWQALYPQFSFSERHHRASRLRALEVVLNEGNFDRAVLPQRVFVFGMAAIPVQWLNVFLALGKHIDVHFLFQNPCQYYWGDALTERQNALYQQRLLQSGDDAVLALSEFEQYESHPLLASLGEVGKNYLGALYRYDEQDGLSEFAASLYESNASGTALAHIQNDLLEGRVECNIADITELELDSSIRFSRCHSRLREVEALRDYVLDVIDQDPSFTLRDFIVMAPDIQQYAPFIDAVFGAPIESRDGGEARLFYGLSDHALAQEQPIIEQFLAVLQLDKKRLTVDEIFDLLSLDAVCSRFDLNAERLAFARKLVDALNIRWGVNESHRDAVIGSSHTGDSHTWLFGLRRALKSYLVGAPDDLKAGFIECPLRSAEQHEVLGILLRVVDLIESNAVALRSTKSVDEWAIRVQQVWYSWFDMNALDESLRQLADKSLDALIEQVEVSGFDQQVPFSLIFAVLQAELEKEKVSQRFLSGRINFCNLMPMRTVPFKAVCLLGMNEGAYPRHDMTQSFDLISQYPARLGDRSRRRDDRYMFLEAILSAEDRLYISYKGFDPKDNSELFPSVLLSELQELCVRSFTDRSSDAAKALVNAWTYQHRLQPFHSAYFNGSGIEDGCLPRSFANEWYPLHAPMNKNEMPSSNGAELALGQADLFEQVAALENEPPHSPPLFEWPEQLELAEWERVFANPLAAYYSVQLGVKSARFIDVLASDEPFALDGLQTYKLARQMCDVWFRGASLDDFIRKHSLLGELPQAPVARASVEEISADYAEFCSRIEPLLAAQPVQLMLRLPSSLAESTVLSGEVYIGDAGLVDVHFSRNPGKWFFGVWARHVAWNVFHAENALPIPATSVCVTPAWQIELPALGGARAKQYLQELVSYFHSAMLEPRPLLPEVAFHYLSGKDKTPQGAFKRTPPVGDLAALWARYCTLSGSDQDAERVPEFDNELIFTQIALHTDAMSRKGDNDVEPITPLPMIDFREVK